MQWIYNISITIIPTLLFFLTLISTIGLIVPYSKKPECRWSNFVRIKASKLLETKTSAGRLDSFFVITKTNSMKAGIQPEHTRPQLWHGRHRFYRNNNKTQSVRKYVVDLIFRSFHALHKCRKYFQFSFYTRCHSFFLVASKPPWKELVEWLTRSSISMD